VVSAIEVASAGDAPQGAADIEVIAPRNYSRIWWCMAPVLASMGVRPQAM
jgi:hypothetical protein